MTIGIRIMFDPDVIKYTHILCTYILYLDKNKFQKYFYFILSLAIQIIPNHFMIYVLKKKCIIVVNNIVIVKFYAFSLCFI